MTIHIFNPEHDYALASFSPYYTPPAEVIRLRKHHALTPLRYASHGDAILLIDSPAETLPHIPPGITLLSLPELPLYFRLHPEAVISPWGWNPMLRHILQENGIPPEQLPDDSWLHMLRNLSHRRTTIDFNRLLNEQLKADPILRRHLSPLPVEFNSSARGLKWLEEHPAAFFKAPWSSSGRGILFTEELDPDRHILPWLNGIIRRQGSVMAETAHPKAIDFATEWEISQSPGGRPEVKYLGVSLFEASRRGKYHSNTLATRERLMQKIKCVAPDFGEAWIEAQRKAIVALLSQYAIASHGDPHICYTGYLGIDMIAAPDGTIRGGIELNFRRTMGIPPSPLCIIGTGNVGTHLHRAFTRAGLRPLLISGRAESFPPAEVYLICVKDSCVAEVAVRIKPIAGAIIAHTSGSIPLADVMTPLAAEAQGCGVFYPLQTFSRDVEMHYDTIPFLIEGSSPEVTSRLMRLASEISNTVVEADSGQRALYHVAAVMTCNFFNHLCTLADDFLGRHNLDLKILLPLLRQTVDKLALTSPSLAQTGPAVRGDRAVIEAHLDHLRDFPDTARIYRMLSDSIISCHNPGVPQDAPDPLTPQTPKYE